MNKQVLANRLLLTFLVILVATTMIPLSYGASAEISGFSVTPDKAGYYVGEVPSLIVKFDYENVANNTQLKIEIYNSTNDLVYTISGITLTGSASLLNGTYEQTHTLTSDFTKETGSEQYTAKLIDVSTGFKLAEAKFTINVQTESIMLLVSWIDASQDRKVDENEQVTFSVFVQWSFVNESKSANLYVKIDGGNELTVDTVSITQGSGQAQAQWQTGFTKGSHTVTFELRDAENKLLATASVTIKVGVTEGASTLDLIKENFMYIAFTALLVLLIVIVVKKK